MHQSDPHAYITASTACRFVKWTIDGGQSPGATAKPLTRARFVYEIAECDPAKPCPCIGGANRYIEPRFVAGALATPMHADCTGGPLGLADGTRRS